MVGVSLSEPHTSVTALHTSVCMLVGLFGPTTYRKFLMSAFKYFTMIECPRRRGIQLSRENEREGLAACLCGHSKCNLLLAQARPRLIQHLSSYKGIHPASNTSFSTFFLHSAKAAQDI